jgi:endo-1,4-beta-mannosidase
MKNFLALALVVLAVSATPLWSVEKATKWHQQQGWRVGNNFIPSTAVNELEMWQAETYDPVTIDRELTWAAQTGFNTIRVFLHLLPWVQNATAFKSRINHFLNIANSKGIKTLFVLFDDCWNPNPELGPQPAPIPGVHNSQWVQCPGQSGVTDTSKFGIYKGYVQDILGSFAKDKRILFWDLYNEPGNSNHQN